MKRLLEWLGVIGSALVLSGLASSSQGGVSGSQSSSIVPTKPAPRKDHSAPEPPALPAGADAIPPTSFTAVTVRSDQNGTAHTLTQRVFRTSDRIRLVPQGSNKEWLFERNRVDPRRVSGFLTDHATRQILVYQESDMRNRQQFRGWADVLMMRFDPQQLARLRRTGESHGSGDATAVHYVAASGAAGLVEVVWSERLLLPLHLTIRDSAVVTTARIEELTATVEMAELADPRRRFPDYDVLDIADAGDHRR